MSSIYSGKNHNLEKQFPGCLGRMVNLFDLSAGIAGNRLLADKPHHDGSPLSRRSQSDVPRVSKFEDQIENKVNVSESSRNYSNRKLNGTSMKMLIAHEMSKEVDAKHNPPSVVAKLMGLDNLPEQQPNLTTQRISKMYSRSNSDTTEGYWQQDRRFWDLRMQQRFQHYPEHDDYKDVCEVMLQSQKPYCVKDKSSQKVGCDGTENDRKFALVRQKFVEAKHLSTDEKLHQSRQFDEALKVLNSNKNLFIKFLQEPNAMFSEHLCHLQSIAHPLETKRITVLRPCKMVDNDRFSFTKKNDKQKKKDTVTKQEIMPVKSCSELSPLAVGWKHDENSTQPTRIVVLKPSPGKAHEIKAVASPLSSSPRIFQREEFAKETEDAEARKSREVAKEITRQMKENLSGHQRDEALLSSVFSNGYIGDESSFHKSENEYAAGHLSDSEVIISPTSRHSWDYVNRFGGPYSSSSFSHASYSPESSVCREAKKRLSERWAIMASNGNCQEQRHVQRSSSTLGEMLALSETKNAMRSVEDDSKNDCEESTSLEIMDSNKAGDMDNSQRNLVRSKSVPVSSMVYGNHLNADIPDQVVSKTDDLKEATKAKNTKLSLKGKVSSLFFSRSKKFNKDKSIPSEAEDDASASVSLGRGSIDGTKFLNDIHLDDWSSPSLYGLPGNMSASDVSCNQGILSPQAGLAVRNSLVSGNLGENQDQPSPISVLETPFVEDEISTTEPSGNNKPELNGELLGSQSNLIGKSPPIGSIARTLSWDESCVDTATSYPSKPSFSPQDAEEEEREWFFFVQTLLAVSGLDGEVHSDTFLSRWHSSESPLDPSLRDKCVDLNDKETLHEAKRRQRRSTRWLVFDCVNAALVDIAGYGPDTCQRARPCSGSHISPLEASSFILVDQVWGQMKEWFSGEERCATSGDCGDSNSLVVERVVRKEVVGKGWAEHLRLEMDNLGKEIERKLLEELVLEAVVELTCRVC